MFPPLFDYSVPKNLTEALSLVENADSKVKVLAGGQSLIPALKARASLISSLQSVVDITRLKELDYIRKEPGTMKIGALTTVAALENNQEIASSLPILHEAASEIADPLVRNLGTVGGNLCLGDPMNDLPAPMTALSASAALVSLGGSREINVEDLYVAPYKTTVKPDEILTQITIPLEGGRRGNAYRKIKKGSGGFTIAGAATSLSLADDNTVVACRLALTGVASKMLRPREAEQALVGKRVEPPVLDVAAKLAVEASRPVSDLYASADYRRKVLGVLVKDSLEASYKRAVTGGYEKS